MSDHAPKHDRCDAFTRTRASLLSRLKRWDDAESWREFFDNYGHLIHSFAVRCGLSATEAEDVVQETLVNVARQMPDFRYDRAKGSFRAWLYNQTRWRIADAFRKRPPQAPAVDRSDATSTGTAELERLPDTAGDNLEQAWDDEWCQNQLARALERIQAIVTPKQYQMFHLVTVQGWPMTDITRTLNVNRAQVYMAKMRVGRLLKAELAKLGV